MCRVCFVTDTRVDMYLEIECRPDARDDDDTDDRALRFDGVCVYDYKATAAAAARVVVYLHFFSSKGGAG